MGSIMRGDSSPGCAVLGPPKLPERERECVCIAARGMEYLQAVPPPPTLGQDSRLPGV